MGKRFSKIDLLRASDYYCIASAVVDREIRNKIIIRAKKGLWFINESGYAYAFDRVTGKRIFMHRVVMEIYGIPIKGFQVDHVNRVRLDNYRANLRVCTAAQNQVNRKLKSETDEKTGFVDVVTVRKAVRVDGKIRIQDVHQAGNTVFSSPIDAAKEADRLRRKRDGEFAVQNFPANHKTKQSRHQIDPAIHR